MIGVRGNINIYEESYLFMLCHTVLLFSSDVWTRGKLVLLPGQLAASH